MSHVTIADVVLLFAAKPYPKVCPPRLKNDERTKGDTSSLAEAPGAVPRYGLTAALALFPLG